MAENPRVNLALVNDIPDGNLEQGTIYMSPDVSGNFIKVAVTDSSTVTIFDGSAYATKQQVIDNEYVVATALNDLNNRIDNIDVELLTNITYSELKALRDTSALVPGMQYRITDYECATSAENTSVGGHAFDIIVTADSSGKLNENARAIQNEGENYFDNANLLAWELKYAIDNDSVYSWSSQDGKGVVYYMKDEFGNECGYDFKNIKFAFVDSSSALIDSSTHYYYTFTDASTDGDLSMKKDSSTICEKNHITAIDDGSVFVLPHTVFIASNSVFNNTIKRASNNVFGVAHDNDMGMIEDCVFDNVFDLNTVETALNTWFKGVAEANHIKYISNSEFGNNFAFNTIRYMSTTKAGDGFMLNDVGDYFLNSSFGNNCFSNFFGPYSGTITAGNDFAENTMQNQCHHLTFGNSCKFNNMGTVGYVRMGNNCTDNFIGNGKYIYFGNSSNQGADWICGNRFEGITQYVYFYNTGSASLSNMLRKYHMFNICGTSDTWKSISETTRNNSKETFVLTRPGYTTPAANSLIYVDPAMLPERTKGGTAGQILVKVSGTDYDMGWRTVNIGSQIAYDSSNKVISLKDASGNVLGTPVDATDFIKDGMVSDVSVYDGNLVISFNTDAGKEDISIPLSHIFDSSNYYTKSESDTKYVWDSSSPWEPGSGTGSAQLKGSGADASGTYSVAEGLDTTASGDRSHAEGDSVIASGTGSHAEGDATEAIGWHSHAEGSVTSARGQYSHTEGYRTQTTNEYEHAQGMLNISRSNTLFSIGNGYLEDQESSYVYSNALEIMRNGDAYLYGVASFDGQTIGTRKTLQHFLNINPISDFEYDIIFNNGIPEDFDTITRLHLYIDDYPSDDISDMMEEVGAETIEDFYDIVYDVNVNGNDQYAGSSCVYANEYVYEDCIMIDGSSYYLWRHSGSGADTEMYAIMSANMTMDYLNSIAKCNNPNSDVSPFVAIVREDLSIWYDDGTTQNNVNDGFQLACYKIDEE